MASRISRRLARSCSSFCRFTDTCMSGITPSVRIASTVTVITNSIRVNPLGGIGERRVLQAMSFLSARVTVLFHYILCIGVGGRAAVTVELIFSCGFAAGGAGLTVNVTGDDNWSVDALPSVVTRCRFDRSKATELSPLRSEEHT